MLEDDCEQMDFPSIDVKNLDMPILNQTRFMNIKEEPIIQKPIQNPYSMSRKSVKTKPGEFLIDSSKQPANFKNFAKTLVLPKNLLEINEERKGRRLTSPNTQKKAAKMKIKMQPGDLINLNENSPEYPKT